MLKLCHFWTWLSLASVDGAHLSATLLRPSPCSCYTSCWNVKSSISIHFYTISSLLFFILRCFLFNGNLHFSVSVAATCTFCRAVERNSVLSLAPINRLRLPQPFRCVEFNSCPPSIMQACIQMLPLSIRLLLRIHCIAAFLRVSALPLDLHPLA